MSTKESKVPDALIFDPSYELPALFELNADLFADWTFTMATDLDGSTGTWDLAICHAREARRAGVDPATWNHLPGPLILYGDGELLREPLNDDIIFAQTGLSPEGLHRLLSQTLSWHRRIRTSEERIADLEAENHDLRLLASTDMLTGVLNKRAYYSAFEREWNRSLREGTPLACLMIDVDYFKRYNDRFGHLAGDRCLAQVAGALRRSLKRPMDLLARYGGEEFSALLPNTGVGGARIVADEMLQRVRDLAVVHPEGVRGYRVTVSVGLAVTLPAPDEKPMDFLARADRALYDAKDEGRDRLRVVAPRGWRCEPATA